METTTDYDAIRRVNRLAFGQEAEGRLVDALRAGGHARLSLVAEEAGQVVGHILFSELPIQTPEGVVEAEPAPGALRGVAGELRYPAPFLHVGSHG
ncbi:MAG TPA: hypothetical protein VFU47_00070, partial [Armatimonadota bacterium]|nr:hypothetical protein [Armatimonadota bacterium]